MVNGYLSSECWADRKQTMKYAAVAAGGPEKAGQRKEHCVQQQNAGRRNPPGKYYRFVYLLSATYRQIGIWRAGGAAALAPLINAGGKDAYRIETAFHWTNGSANPQFVRA